MICIRYSAKPSISHRNWTPRSFSFPFPHGLPTRFMQHLFTKWHHWVSISVVPRTRNIRAGYFHVELLWCAISYSGAAVVATILFECSILDIVWWRQRTTNFACGLHNCASFSHGFWYTNFVISRCLDFPCRIIDILSRLRGICYFTMFVVIDRPRWVSPAWIHSHKRPMSISYT